jgi:hypothetical protein
VPSFSALATLGYACTYEPRSESGHKQDGCLIAWRKALLRQQGPPLRVDLDDLARVANPSASPRLLRHNVGHIVFLVRRASRDEKKKDSQCRNPKARRSINTLCSSSSMCSVKLPPWGHAGIWSGTGGRCPETDSRQPEMDENGDCSEEIQRSGDQEVPRDSLRVRPLLVANVHLFWNPAYEDVKVAQQHNEFLACLLLQTCIRILLNICVLLDSSDCAAAATDRDRAG